MEIIKNDVINYTVVSIPENRSILEHLKKDVKWQFRLQRVSDEQFLRFQKALKEEKLLDFRSSDCYIAGYNPFTKGNSFLSSGGLKLSSDEEEFTGSFVIENDRIIYTPLCKFYEERDAFVYSKTDYYTTISMPQLLEQELTSDREFLIDMGEEMVGLIPKPVLVPVSCSEMMEYAINPSKGKEAYQKRIRPFG